MKVIVLDIPWDFHYGREVRRGVYRYAQSNHPWTFADIRSPRERKKWLQHSDTVGVISMRQPQAYAADARRYDLAVVSVGGRAPSPESSGLPYVNVAPKAVGEMAADYFVRRGFRNFGAIASSSYFHSPYRGKAFVSALRRRKLTCDVFDRRKKYPQCDEPPSMVFDTSARVCRWLKSLPKPLAMFCVDDYLGLWICDLCRRLDIHVPEEVAILGVGNDDMFCEMSRPHLSSIAVPAEQVGYKAARLLDAILCDPKAPKRTVLLPPIRVITRQSTDVMAIDDCRIVEAVRFIREHANERIRVEKVAKEVSLPRRMLERRFRAALHRSPFAEIRRVQIENVKMFLAQTDKTLEAIAPECGFSDVSRMGRAFRETVKMSPGAYRKQYRNH